MERGKGRPVSFFTRFFGTYYYYYYYYCWDPAAMALKHPEKAFWWGGQPGIKENGEPGTVGGYPTRKASPTSPGESAKW